VTEDEIVKHVLRRPCSVDAILTLPNGGFLAQGDASSACRLHGQFDVIVLCAQELQRKVKSTHPPNARAKLAYAPNDDATLTVDQVIIAFRAAELASEAVRMGRRVLVTCMQGRNRSGLVSALTVHMLTGVGGQQAIEIVRRRRVKAPALTNDSFNNFLAEIPALRVDKPRDLVYRSP
jgi:hypothetical protein